MKLICNIILFLSTAVAAAEEVPTPKVDELTSAYQREILFLSTYKKELQNKIDTVRNTLGDKVTQGKRELDQLEKNWLSLQTKNELLLTKLDMIERDYENRKENRELLDTTLKQATIGKSSVDNSDKDVVEQMEAVFASAMQDLRKSREISHGAGEFYLKNGEQAKGEIYQVGRVARFAKNDKGLAALYPTGGGHFKVWSWLSDSAITQGQLPDTFAFFLFENPEKEFVAKTEKTVLSVVQSGGLIGWIIVLMGFFVAAVSFYRFVLLRRAEIRDEVILTQAMEKLRENNIDEAQHILLRENNATSRVLNQTLSYLRAEPAKVDDAIMESILKESQLIDRFGVVILVIASVAPLMGLLGTVTGMISTFDIITQFGTGNPKLLSGGISEALVTTMLGLIVAIPSLLIGQFLSSRNEKIKTDMEKWALATCNAYKNRGEAN